MAKWRRTQRPKDTRVVELVGGRRVNAVGEASFQAQIEAIVGGKTDRGHDYPVRAFLIREPKNPHDPNAVKVQVDGATVGYLCREDAAAYQPALRRIEKADAIAICAGRITGGWRRPGDDGFFGVWLDLADPAGCLPFTD